MSEASQVQALPSSPSAAPHSNIVKMILHAAWMAIVIGVVRQAVGADPVTVCAFLRPTTSGRRGRSRLFGFFAEQVARKPAPDRLDTFEQTGIANVGNGVNLADFVLVTLVTRRHHEQ